MSPRQPVLLGYRDRTREAGPVCLAPFAAEGNREMMMQPDRRTTVVAWSVCAGCVLLLFLTLWFVALGWPDRLPPGFVPWSGQVVTCIGAVGAPVLGALVAAHRPGNRYGWVWLLSGLALAVFLAGRAYTSYSVAAGEPGTGLAGTVSEFGWMLWLASVPFLLLLFPTGAPPSRRWRWVARAAGLGAGLLVLAGSFAPELGTVPIANPLRAPIGSAEVLGGIADAGVYLIFAAVIASAVSLVFRYRSAADTERRQVAWFAYAGTMIGLLFLLDPFVQPPPVWDALVESLAMVVLYLGIGIAILRHGLYDIDRLVNRTLVYVTLTALLLGTYLLLVGYLGSVLRARGDTVVALAATGLVAVAFAPLRDRLQLGMNRLMYGQQVDPYAVVSQLGHRLESVLAPEEVLPTIVRSIATALDLPQVEVWYSDGRRLRLGAFLGEPPPSEEVGEMAQLDGERGITMLLPLAHRGQAVGVLAVSGRADGDDLPTAQRLLLRDLAAQIGPAAHAVMLTAELRSTLADVQRSREHLVTAQQEERLRIHRDLHDGLGPVLASMRLRLEACLESVPPTASGLTGDLERLHALVGGATADIRSLVHDLYPPELAQLGLLGALRQHCERLGSETGLAVRFSADSDLVVPAATQVAVLRIVQEALVNVGKHAAAHRVDVAIDVRRGLLHLSVTDDGSGIPEDSRNSGGAGIGSMRARAEQLGGALHVTGGDGGGTRLTARIPVGVRERQEVG